MTAPGNQHCLGIHILSHWLDGKGIRSQILERADSATLLEMLPGSGTQVLGISLALPEQRDRAEELIQSLRIHLGAECPLILASGNAVKRVR